MSESKLEFENQDAAIKHFEENGFIVRTQEQDGQYYESKLSEGISKHMGEVLGGLDNAVKDTIGIDKAETGEKTSDYVVRVLTQQKESIEKAQLELKKHLDGQVGKDETMKTLQSQLDQVKKDLKTANGTMVNGKNIDVSLLVSGSVIRIGTTDIIFEEKVPETSARGPNTILRKVNREMEEGKGYKTIMREIIRDVDTSK